MSQYPGSEFVLSGGRLQAQTANPRSEKLLIIGTAQDGPLNRQVQVTDLKSAKAVFGPASYIGGYLDPADSTNSGLHAGASIPLAIEQAVAAGCDNIWVVRATGSYATASSAFGSMLDIRSINPGRIYNGVSLTSTPSSSGLNLTLTQPAAKGVSFTVSYASGKSISNMIDDLNNEPRNKTIFIVRETWSAYLENSVTTLGSGTVTLSGGTNGCRAKNEDYSATNGVSGYAAMLTAVDTGTFDSLLGQKVNFDVCVLTNIYIDDQVSPTNATSTSISYDYSIWLDQMSASVSPCFGVIAVRPPNIRSETNLINWVNNNLLATTPAAWDSNQKWNCAGPFIYNAPIRSDPTDGNWEYFVRLAVVGGPEVVLSNSEIGSYTDMWHVLYAALLTSTPPERAPVMQQLPGVTAYGTAIPSKYCDKLLDGLGFNSASTSPDPLSGRGAYVVLTRNPRNPLGPMVIYDDVTAAYRNNYFRNYQLLHLCNNIHNQLNNALAGFIGGPTSAGPMAAMETRIQNVMDGYASSGALKGGRGVGYEFQVTMSGTDAILGAIKVFITINPTSALRKIYFTVAVRQVA